MGMSKEEFRARFLRDQAIRKMFAEFEFKVPEQREGKKKMISLYFGKSLLGDNFELDKLERRAHQLDDGRWSPD
jgi:AAA+ superfamily predicted ATPase